jgi:hypothetical protein
MNTDTTGHPGSRGQALLLRASVVAAAAAGTALLTTACGGGPPNAGPASQQAASAANQQAAAASVPPAQQAQLTQLAQQYTACMRSHGVTNFPDPSPGGGFQFDVGGIDTHSSRFQAATQACQNIMSKVHKLVHSG